MHSCEVMYHKLDANQAASYPGQQNATVQRQDLTLKMGQISTTNRQTKHKVVVPIKKIKSPVSLRHDL